MKTGVRIMLVKRSPYLSILQVLCKHDVCYFIVSDIKKGTDTNDLLYCKIIDFRNQAGHSWIIGMKMPA
jgi:hypothetical protein